MVPKERIMQSAKKLFNVESIWREILRGFEYVNK